MDIRTTRFVCAAAILAGAGLSLGCVRGPDVQSGLGLRRVVIYRNGVGYFQREGRVEDEEVSFRVRTERVGDFLATLAVIEKNDSSVKSVSFPVDVKGDKDEDADDEGGGGDGNDPRFEVLLKPPPAKKKEKKDHLETVKLSLDGRQHELVIGYVAETPVWRPSYRLVINTPDKVEAGKPAPPAVAPTAYLQAWGIVQNLSGEDWKGVHLSLVAGAPIAFQATLEKAVIPLRPTVSDQGEVISAVPVGETSLADYRNAPAPPPPPPPPPSAAPGGGGGATLDGLLAEEATKNEKADDAEGWASAKGKDKKLSGKRLATKYPTRRAEAPAPAPSSAAYAPPAETRAPAAPPVQRYAPSPPRNVRALAAVAVEGGATHYDLASVDVPNKSATMVMLLSKSVPGESSYLFAPEGGVPDSGSHPFRVARFTNDTPGLLERGPIAVFENGAFLGQGMVDPLPIGAKATVPFALERGLAVQTARDSNEEGSRLAQIEGGRLEIDRDWVTHTKYTIKNGTDALAKVLVKHPRAWNTRLHDAPKETEDNTGTGTALVPIEIPSHAQKVLDVDERRVQRRAIDWLDPLADEAVKGYLADDRSDKAVVAQLRTAWEARGKLRTTLDERDKLNAERRALDAQVYQLNSSLRAIEKNKLADALRKDLTERLAKATARIDDITKRTVVLDMTVSEQSIRFRDLINVIKMVKPLPVN
jgi:hypothetical protein